MTAQHKRKTYHHGELRPVLVQAALDIVRKKGVESLTMRSVAKAAKVSHMAAYHHFADKATLVAAVAEEGFQGLRREMQERMVRCPDNPRAKFRESGIAYVVYAVANPNLFRVMFGPEAADSSAHPGLDESAKSAFGLVQGLVEESQASSSLLSEDSRQIGLTAWALVHGLAVLCIDGQFGPEAATPEGAERMAYAATGALFKGLRRR